MIDNATYKRLTEDPITGPIVKALGEQDAATYNGNSDSDYEVRITTCAKAVSRAVERAIAARLWADAETIGTFVANPVKAVLLVAMLLDGSVRLTDEPTADTSEVTS